MPRGQYDRSKSKAQRDAEKKLAGATPGITAAAKGKKARAPWGSKSGKAAKSVGTPGVGTTIESYNLFALGNLRSQLTSGSVNTLIVGKLDTLITAKLDAMIADLTPAESKVSNGEVKKVTAPIVAQAPAPGAFNPATPPNQA